MKNKIFNIILFVFSFAYIYAENSFIDNSIDTTFCTNCDIPVANAGSNQTYYKLSTVTLDGSNSYDPEGSDLTYQWTSISGLQIVDADLATPSFDIPDISVDTDYVFELVVNDGEYNSESSQVTIFAKANNTAPSPIVQTSLQVNKGSIFIIDASASNDATLHTSPFDFNWSYPDFTLQGNDGESIISLLAPNVNVDTDFIVSLILDDGVSQSSQIDIIVTVIANIIPFAVPGQNMSIGAGGIFSLDGAGSYDYDSDDSNLSYTWTKPAGFTLLNGTSLSSAQIDLQAPNNQGDYDFTLVVNDGSDNSNIYNTSNLFISEVLDASGAADRYIEIYNGTSNTVDLSDYNIRITKNNGTTYDLTLNDQGGGSFNASGQLQSGQVIVVVDSDSGNDLLLNLDAASSNPDGLYNDIQFIEWTRISDLGGDDALELYHNGVLIDLYGTPGFDPGNGWNINGADNYGNEIAEDLQATNSKTLVRKNWVLDGVTQWSSASPGLAECLYDNAREYGCSQWDVYDRNTYDYGGFHYCGSCDNTVTVSVLQNLAPTAEAGLGFSAFVGSTITLDGSASTDPEGDNLQYSWTSNSSGLVINNSDTATPNFVVPSVADGTVITFTLEVSDGVSTVTDVVLITVNAVNQAPIISYTISMTDDDDNNVNIVNNTIFEKHIIYFDASQSDDSGSSTGQIIYNWTANSAEIEFSDNDAPNPNVEIGEYFASDQIFIITLEVGDGELTSSQDITLNLEARMPIISVDAAALTGYEGDYVRMEALSTFDPNGNIEDLEFDWNGNNNTIFGVCTSGGLILDNSGNLLGSMNYNSIDWCDISTDCAVGTCSREKAVAFRLLSTSIGQNTDYDVFVEVEDNDGYDSEDAQIVITSVARYPVAFAGVDKTYTEGTKIILNGLGSHDPQEDEVIYSHWDDDGTWENDSADDLSGIMAFYDGTEKMCSIYSPGDGLPNAFENTCIDDSDCTSSQDSKCVTKLVPKKDSNGQALYQFTWTANTLTEAILKTFGYTMDPAFIGTYTYLGNDVNPEFVIPDTYFDSNCGASPQDEELEFSLEISDLSECGVNCDTSTGPDDTGVTLLSTNTSEVEITIQQNCKPIADGGREIVFNQGSTGEARETKKYIDEFRAHTGQEFVLDATRSFDDTPTGTLIYEWTLVDNSSDWQVVSEDPKPSFIIPVDLCIDGESLDEKSCCENNGGIWSNLGVCSDLTLWNRTCDDDWVTSCEDDSDCSINSSCVTGKKIHFKLRVSDGSTENGLYSWSDYDDISIYYNSYTIPSQPTLYATGTHYEGQDFGQINLFWDNNAESSIDGLTQYSDFQGYKIYRSEDYGQTWGSASSIVDGEILGWEPYFQFHMSAVQDSSYCLFSYDNNESGDCSIDSEGNPVSDELGVPVIRGVPISDIVDWYPGYAWQNLGEDQGGLSQTFVDPYIIDNVDYTYTITAYDRGVKPDTSLSGHWGAISDDGTWDSKIWVRDLPLYTFHDTMHVDSVYFYNLNHEILESFILGPDDDLNPNDSNSNPDVYVNGNQILKETHFFKLKTPDEWNGYVSAADIENGVGAGWSLSRGYPLTNPHGYPKKWSLESELGVSEDDQNFVTVRAGGYASNVTFPDVTEYDEFFVADCKAVGNGGKYYEIVNEIDLDTSLVRFEIEADEGANIFEGYASENPCLYAYRVEKIEYPYAPTEYPPLELDGEDITHYLQGADPNWYVQNPGDLSYYLGLPGVSVDNLNSLTPQITIPNYLVDCHELSYIDDANYQGNWTDFFNGVRMRFDNALRTEPISQNVAVSEIYSYPDSSIARRLTSQFGNFGYINLKYSNNFENKPAYDYEIELFNSPVDYALYNTTDQFDGPGEYSCNTTFSTPLPFRIKNLTTGEYVKVTHNDKGIWNGSAANVPSYFEGNATDFSTHPGSGDCVWSPGERITFSEDLTTLGQSQQATLNETFNLEMLFESFTILISKPELCQSYSDDYDQALVYPAGACVYHEGMTWIATSTILPVDNFIPNEWYNDLDETTELNMNPWTAIYPWNDGTKIVIKPVKWYVDGDYWITDMSLLGAADPQVSNEDLDKILVVPNPYIINSQFNESFSQKRINFTKLPQECKISIFTSSGELVDVIYHKGGEDTYDGNAFWDLKNDSGRDVAPGLYIYKVEAPSGATTVNKFVIIR